MQIIRIACQQQCRKAPMPRTTLGLMVDERDIRSSTSLIVTASVGNRKEEVELRCRSPDSLFNNSQETAETNHYSQSTTVPEWARARFCPRYAMLHVSGDYLLTRSIQPRESSGWSYARQYCSNRVSYSTRNNIFPRKEEQSQNTPFYWGTGFPKLCLPSEISRAWILWRRSWKSPTNAQLLLVIFNSCLKAEVLSSRSKTIRPILSLASDYPTSLSVCWIQVEKF